MAETPRPTYADIEAMLTDRKDNVFSSFRRECEDDDAHINATDTYVRSRMGQQARVFPADWPLRVVPVAKYAMTNMALGVVNGEPPSIEAKFAHSSGYRGTYDEAKDNVEAWCRDFLHWVQHHGNEDPIWDASLQQSGLGAGWLAYGVDKAKIPVRDRYDSDEDYDEACRNCMPFSVRSVHPRNVMDDTDDDEPTDVLIEEQVSINEARRLYGDKVKLPDGNGGKRTLQRIIYCSKDWYGIWVAGQPVIDGAVDGVAENPWGRIWVQGALSGLGKQSESYDLVNRRQGIIRGMRDLIISIIIEYNNKQYMHLTRGMTGRDFMHDPQTTTIEEAQLAAANYETGPLAANVLPAGIRVVNQDPPQIPNWMADLSAETRSWLEMVTGTNLLRGGVGTDNATVEQQRYQLATRLFGPARAAFNQMVGQMLMDILHYLKHNLASDQRLYLPSKLTADGMRMLTPDQIPDGLQITVNYQAASQAERMQSKQADAAEYDMGAIDMDVYRDRQGITDGAEIDRRAIKRKLMMSDAMMRVYADFVAQQAQQELPKRVEDLRRRNMRDGVVEQPPAPEQAVPAAAPQGQGMLTAGAGAPNLAPMLAGMG